MKAKVAVVDLLLHYPPKGGACVDLLNVLKLLAADFDLMVFTPKWASEANPRGRVEGIPLPVKVVEIAEPARQTIIAGFEAALGAWEPDIVYLADGWTLKPYLTKAFRKRWPTLVKFYAYEGLCPRNNQRWLPGGRCGSHLFLDEAGCLRCAQEYHALIKEKRAGGDNPLTEEMALSGIFSGDYGETMRGAVKGLHAIVSNRLEAAILEEAGAARVSVVPGGVDTALFTSGLAPTRGAFEILVAGRMTDAAKGASTALEAGALLAERGLRFRMTMTRPKTPGAPSWLEERGWVEHDKLIELYRRASCAVVPSLWDEAFGLAWAEALAAGVPVAASAVPGPLEYLVDGENALLFPPGDAQALAAAVVRLAHDPALRGRLAEAGSKLARGRLTWDNAAKETKAAIEAALGAER